MSLIRTNLSALLVLQHSREADLALGRAIERLGSGLRVNSARDDAAGQAISNRLTSQISGQKMAARNANDGISLAATAEGALSSVNERLQRVRQLTVQGVNGALSQEARDTIQNEINLNLKEIDRIATMSKFNGIPLLDGSAGRVGLQVGANDAQSLAIDLGGSGFGVEALGLKDFYISGISGDILDINTLPGSSVNVILADANTTVTYSDTSGNALPSGTKLMRQSGGAASWYVQSVDGNGDPIHYLASHQTHSTTATRSSQVDVTADTNRFFQETDVVGGNVLGAIAYRDESGNALPAASSGLVRDDTNGHYYLRRQESGETVYYRATVTSTSGGAGATYAASTTVQIQSGSPRFSTTDYTENVPVPGLELATATVDWEASDGNPFSDGALRELVEVGGEYYVRAGDAGDVRYYAAALTVEHDNAQVSVQVDTSAGPVTTRTFAAYAVHPETDASSFLALDGTPVASASIVESDGNLFLRDDSTNTYFSATLSYQDGSGNVVDPGTFVGPVTAVIQASTNQGLRPAGFAEGAANTVSHTPSVPSASAGLPAGTMLVEGSDGRFYLRSSDADGLHYEPVSLTSHVAQDGSVSFLAAVSSGTSRMRADFDTASGVTAVSTETLSGGAPVYAIGGAELVVNENNRYFIRQLAGGSVQFNYASITTTTQSDGSYALQVNNAGLASQVNDVGIVSGSSTVALNTPLPPNVEVMYEDSTGKVHSNVLGRDADGNYILNLPDHGSGKVKTATLVQVDNLEDHLISQDGDLLVRTVNGSGDVVIYYAMSYSALTNAGNDLTQVVITEEPGQIRIRQPRDPLAALDRAIAQVDSKRGELGAVQNRLESVIDTLVSGTTNLTAARSRILDADYANEVSAMSRAQILQQASVSLLSQANQAPQMVLKLLQ